ncbi:helix-turn-helix domain-containing protein [Halobacillus litoralis]|uniref:Helix-turn-helix domain-containing protein n=1 Tax=Halobacillus litoralis TaxID=45668 RepID=A0A410M9H6_9BACI|nr:helix-turn-helix domain-containing protein [Halobacillus litoralis]QAS51372.1 hypothetical protein HLI_03645 [Halobacillus litoralis]
MELVGIREKQRFATKTELDRHVRSFLFKRKAALSEGTLTVLRFIWRHAVKYPGVAFPRKQTIVGKTGLSESTVSRALRCLVKEGLIEKAVTTKPNGRQGANLLIFLPQADLFLPADDTPHDPLHDIPPKVQTPDEHKPQPIKSTPETENKQRKASFSKFVPLDHSFLPSFIPSEFIDTTKPFLEAEQVLAAWRTVESAYRQLKMNLPVIEYMTIIKETFKQTVFAYKNGLVRTELLRYFYGGMVEVFRQTSRREGFESRKSILAYDWLNA